MTILHDKTGMELSRPEMVAPLLREWLSSLDNIDRDKEYVFALYLGSSYTIRAVDVVTMGIADAALVHPREVFRRAISLGAVDMVVAHNHTDGRCEPSKEDVKTTQQLVNAGKIIGISLLDSIIFTANGHYSMRRKQSL